MYDNLGLKSVNLDLIFRLWKTAAQMYDHRRPDPKSAPWVRQTDVLKRQIKAIK